MSRAAGPSASRRSTLALAGDVERPLDAARGARRSSSTTSRRRSGDRRSGGSRSSRTRTAAPASGSAASPGDGNDARVRRHLGRLRGRGRMPRRHGSCDDEDRRRRRLPRRRPAAARSSIPGTRAAVAVAASGGSGRVHPAASGHEGTAGRSPAPTCRSRSSTSRSGRVDLERHAAGNAGRDRARRRTCSRPSSGRRSACASRGTRRRAAVDRDGSVAGPAATARSSQQATARRLPRRPVDSRRRRSPPARPRRSHARPRADRPLDRGQPARLGGEPASAARRIRAFYVTGRG